MEHKDKSIIEHLEVVYRRKWLFAIPVMIGLAAGLFLAFTLPSYYSSTTLILVESQQVPVEYVTPTDKTPFMQRLNVLSQQVLSRSKLEKVIKDYNLYAEDRAPGLLSSLNIFKRLKGDAEKAPTKEGVIMKMRNDISFKVAGDPTLASRRSSEEGGGKEAFTITYTGPDPEITRQVTNTLASLFIEENMKAREQYAEGTSEFLTNELDKAKLELENFERMIKAYKESHMGSLPEQLEANLRTLDRLQMELQSITIQIKGLEEKKLLIRDQPYFVPSAPSASSEGNFLVKELDTLRNELASLLSMYKENYPDVVITKKRIKELESRMQPSGEKDKSSTPVDPRISEVNSQIAALKSNEAELRKQMEEYQARVENTPSNEQKQADLFRDYKISLENYQALLGKKLNAQLAENLEKRQKGERFRVIDPANLPESPDKPNKPLIMFLGLVSGAAVGIGLVFLFEFMNPAFRKPEDFSGLLQLPVLACVPVFAIKGIRPGEAKLKVIKGKKLNA